MNSLSPEIAISKTDDAVDGARMFGDEAFVILNADDWGRDFVTTDRIFDCHRAGSISSVSGMVYMDDSERAAEIARDNGIDVGLHLNFTLPFSGQGVSSHLAEHQAEIAQVLNGHRLASALYYPRLVISFDYVVKAQTDEFERIYGEAPRRFDGHHHMHLCANVLGQRLLPAGAIVRRNLSFSNGEKHFINRIYRHMQDRRLARRYRITDYFFDLHPPEDLTRLKRIFQLGSQFNVEIETHPIRGKEYSFLMNGKLQQHAGATQVATGYLLRPHTALRAGEYMR